jgi:hypothetical protein
MTSYAKQVMEKITVLQQQASKVERLKELVEEDEDVVFCNQLLQQINEHSEVLLEPQMKMCNELWHKNST